MRSTIAQLLAIAMCVGLFFVTCPLTAQTTAPAPALAQSNCCAVADDAQHCAGSDKRDQNERERCCVSHSCGSVISVAAATIVSSHHGASEVIFNRAPSIADRAEQPPVPPPRSSLA